MISWRQVISRDIACSTLVCDGGLRVRGGGAPARLPGVFGWVVAWRISHVYAGASRLFHCCNYCFPAI